MINNQKIHDPFFSSIWSWLKSIPLTTLKLKLSKNTIPKAIEACKNILSQWMYEIDQTPNSKLSALQFRLARILYKVPIYNHILQLKENIYEYKDSIIALSKARSALKQAIAYTKITHSDKALVSKVRQNKAFEMRRQMNIAHYGKRNSSPSQSKPDFRLQESKLQFSLCHSITSKLLLKCWFLTLKLHSKIGKEIKSLVDYTKGNLELKKRVFNEFKQLWIGKHEEINAGLIAAKHIKRRKLFMCFKSWQDIKAIQAKKVEKEAKAKQILKKRKLYRVFYYYKLGIVANRIEYLDEQIVDKVYQNTLKIKIITEWGRLIQSEKTIKTKVIRKMNGISEKFIGMTKVQIDEHFITKRREGIERINEDVITLKLERSHYKNFIKNELRVLDSKVSKNWELKIIYETKTFYDKNNCERFNKGNVFIAARDFLWLTPKNVKRNNLHAKSLIQDEFIDALKSHNYLSSASRMHSESHKHSTNEEIDFERSIIEKEKIHRSYHHFKHNRSFSFETNYRSSVKQSQPIIVQQMSLLESKGLVVHDSPYSRVSMDTLGRGNIISFPKPLPSRVLTPRGAPNDLFKNLENKLKSSKGTTSNLESRFEFRSVNANSIVEKIYDPELKIKDHIRNLIRCMRMLRDVPKDYFRKSYFIQNPQIDPKDSIKTLEDILREGRRLNPDMRLSKLFWNIHGSKLINLWFTQWKIAFIQNLICKDMCILQKYKMGKLALSAIITYIKQKKADTQEMQFKREVILKAKWLKSWRNLSRKQVNFYIMNKFFKKWRSMHNLKRLEKAKEFDCMLFRERLLKQKVIYILYRYTQWELIPKKKYQHSLKTKAMYSLIVNHNQIKKLKRIVTLHLDNEKLNTINLKVLTSSFTKWKLDFINNRSNEFGAQAILNIAHSKYR